ncbi:hypothetical protein Q3G72_026892 [Acer saccharum]|nr:hypothetical protein Q3G72_026892 [Acer saccharum]
MMCRCDLLLPGRLVYRDYYQYLNSNPSLGETRLVLSSYSNSFEWDHRVRLRKAGMGARRDRRCYGRRPLRFNDEGKPESSGEDPCRREGKPEGIQADEQRREQAQEASKKFSRNPKDVLSDPAVGDGIVEKPRTQIFPSHNSGWKRSFPGNRLKE